MGLGLRGFLKGSEFMEFSHVSLLSQKKELENAQKVLIKLCVGSSTRSQDVHSSLSLRDYTKFLWESFDDILH